MSHSRSAAGSEPSSIRTAKSMAAIRTKYSASTPGGRIGTWSASARRVRVRSLAAAKRS